MPTYSAVVTTGIYCRPGCSARPLARNVLTFEHPAAAEAAGFRACHRCRPYRVAAPLPATAPELVCEAVQQIIGGALDDAGTEAALADRIGLSARHLRRLFRAHLGVTPDQLARSRRAHFARRLLDDTDLNVLDVAFASGFGSLRQFNRTMREVFREAPSDLRNRRHRTDRLAADGGLTLRLPVVPGYDWDTVRDFLAVRLVPGVEAFEGVTYRRIISVASAPGLLEVSPCSGDFLLLRVHLPYWEGLIHIVERAGQLLGTGGLPGIWDSFEAGVWAILAARPDRDLVLTDFVTALGTAVPGLPDGLTHTFPDRGTVADASVRLGRLGLSATEAAAVQALTRDHGRNSDDDGTAALRRG